MIEERRSIWPGPYYARAKERVAFNRLQMAENRMAACTDIDKLADVMADLEGILEGKITYDELAGLYRKREAELMG